MHLSRATAINICVFLAVLAIAIGLRIADFPRHQLIRNMDETGYCAGSLQLIEGITPGYKAAPAGPLFWTGWVWVGGQTVFDLLHPTPGERKMSLAVRPFAALNRALFDNYRDIDSLHRVMVIANLVIALLGTLAAVGLGLRYGGAIGGFLVGGLFASIPVFLQLSEMSRPYSMAWSFGMISLFFASDTRPRRWFFSAIFLGLSIGSRIEMVCLLPLVWWVLWDGDRLVRLVMKTTLVSLLVAVWVAPWLVTHLIGNLRTIATVKVGGPPGGAATVFAVLKELLIAQGMGAAILLALIGLTTQPAGARFRRATLALYTLLLVISTLSGYAYGMHQHGELFIALLLLLAVLIQPLMLRWPKSIGIAAIFAVLFPLGMSLLSIRTDRDNDTHEEAVAWIEQHVPAGTTVYLLDGGTRSLLPTPESAAALWDEVNDDQAWQKKMQSGLSRFNLTADELPRALSEENLIQERGNRRKWFILASQTDLPLRRYDIHLVLSSPVFGVRDLDAALQAHGGVVLWRDGFDLPLPKLGDPVKQWVSRSGDTVKIFCSPEVRSKSSEVPFSGGPEGRDPDPPGRR